MVCAPAVRGREEVGTGVGHGRVQVGVSADTFLPLPVTRGQAPAYAFSPARTRSSQTHLLVGTAVAGSKGLGVEGETAQRQKTPLLLFP